MAYRAWSGAALAVVALMTAGHARAADDKPVAVFGNRTTIELAPVLLAAERSGVTVKMGGVNNLVGEPGAPGYSSDGLADVATNAETQALRFSVKNPNLRIVMTVTEGLYRMVAKKSAGIGTLADLKGKRIATIPATSSGYFTALLLAKAGLSYADVTAVPIAPLGDMPKALAEGKVDAVSIWEPEVENAARAIGNDAIAFSGKGVYRELFNLNTTAEALADPARRKKIVAFMRAIIKAAADLNEDPAQAKQLVSAASGYSPEVVERSWKHHAYIAAMPKDMLDVLVAEEMWLAGQEKRAPRDRAALSKLIDTSALAEALKD
ncbi:MAG: ABC transporter substrate-binding protein [Sphingobium sp.]|nr:ABC transporter substrate-binding protein [Sphingobium sp.]